MLWNHQGKQYIFISGRDWPTRFLVSLICQPVTFTGSSIALWWYPTTTFIPPVHLSITLFCLLAYDFTRDDEPWEKGWDQGGRHRWTWVLIQGMESMTSFFSVLIGQFEYQVDVTWNVLINVATQKYCIVGSHPRYFQTPY